MAGAAWHERYDCYDSDGAVDTSDWTNSKDPFSNQIRSDIIHRILETGTLDQLRTLVHSGWDVNEALNIGYEPMVLLYYLISRTSFYVISRSDALEICQLLLEHGANPDIAHSVHKGGRLVHMTPLCVAIQQNMPDVVKMLLDAGAKCTTSDAVQNPLALALQNKDCPLDLITLLLQYGVDPNDHDDQLENIPLLNAIKICKYSQNGTTVVQLLLEHGANPNINGRINKGGDRDEELVLSIALHEAVRQGLTEVVNMLLEAGGQFADASENPLALALQNLDCPSNLIELLLKHGAHPNHHDGQLENIPLLKAITSDYQYDLMVDESTCRKKTVQLMKIVQLLLKHEANPNVSHRVNIGGYEEAKWVHRTALYEAVKKQMTVVVKMLIDAGAKYTMSDALQNLLVLALENYDCEPAIIKLLLEHGADPNGDQLEDIPLLGAIEKKTMIAVQLLLEHGANPNVSHRVNIGEYGEAKWVHRTALHEAVKKQMTVVVKMLLDAGAKCTTSDALQNLLVLALQNYICKPAIIKLLLEHGADPIGDQLADIPLLCAIENKKTFAVQLLLEHGANPNVTQRVNKGRHGKTKWVQRTALHEAVERGWIEGVKILLDAGARCKGFDASQNLLALALQGYDCSPDLIELLLIHSNDQQIQDIPVFLVVKKCRDNSSGTKILELFLEHGANPNAISKVNFGNKRKPKKRQWTVLPALHEAARQGWTEGVKILLDAGAKCKMPIRGALENPLMLALKDCRCSPELIELLLKHGADPNYHITDKDKDIPLAYAFKKHLPSSKIVPLLLDHGANPNITHRTNIRSYKKPKWVHRRAIHEAVERKWTEGVKMLLDAGARCSGLGALDNPLMLALENDSPPDLLELLLKHGADTVVRDMSLLRGLSRYICKANPVFRKHLLDFFFLKGGNINMEDGLHKTALECAITKGGHSNNVRWLIRHGADALLKFTQLKWYFIDTDETCFPETPLILLQAGMRVSHGVQTQLSNMEEAMTTWLQKDSLESRTAQGKIQRMWVQLAKVEEEGDQQRMQSSLKKSTFLEYHPQQMVDLQEFSDVSLHVYPMDNYIGRILGKRQRYQKIVELINNVLDFLREPQSLQWHCRRCVRENLVSLQPSVIKTLQVPTGLKCYILCHEI